MAGGPGGNGGTYGGDIGRFDETRRIEGGPVDPRGGNGIQSQAQAEQAYADMMRDIGRLRNDVASSGDRELNREYQELARQAAQLDPKKWASNPQLDQVINGQVLPAIDQMELLLRRKLDANDGSVRSVNPRNTPPGYASAVAEYYKRLSKQ
jgi:hypothetical protein